MEFQGPTEMRACVLRAPVDVGGRARPEQQNRIVWLQRKRFGKYSCGPCPFAALQQLPPRIVQFDDGGLRLAACNRGKNEASCDEHCPDEHATRPGKPRASR